MNTTLRFPVGSALVLVSALVGLTVGAAAQVPAPVVSLRYAEYDLTLTAPARVLVFGLLNTGDLVQIYPAADEVSVLPAGRTTIGLRRDGLWIVGGPPASYEVSGGSSSHCLGEAAGKPDTLTSMRDARPCVEVRNASSTVRPDFLRPARVLVLVTDPGAAMPDVARALAGFKVRGKAPDVAADLARALERAAPAVRWAAAASR